MGNDVLPQSFAFQHPNSPGGNWPAIIGTPIDEPSGGDTIATPGQVPTGAMFMWGTATPPSGWLLCDGTAVSRTAYKKLFELYGTTFGAGDGSTTFNLPDFRQRFPLGKAAAGTGSTLGGTGGTINHTHDPHDATQGIGAGGAFTGPDTHSPENPPFLAVNFIIKT